MEEVKNNSLVTWNQIITFSLCSKIIQTVICNKVRQNKSISGQNYSVYSQILTIPVLSTMVWWTDRVPVEMRRKQTLRQRESVHQTTPSEVGKKTLVFDSKHFGEKTNLFEPWQSWMYTLQTFHYWVISCSQVTVMWAHTHGSLAKSTYFRSIKT